MKRAKFIATVCCLLFLQNYLSAQDKLNIKFGKVTPEDFDLSKYKFDSGAAAVVIADIGASYYESNYQGSLQMTFTHQKRIKILDKKGFDAATIAIPLYTDGHNNGEQLKDLKASTYNLENGQVIETKLDNKSVFADEINKNLILKKFTFPALKEGSIIEFSYRVESGIQLNLHSWKFQGKYPCLWSEYQVSIPEYFNYVILSQGFHPYLINSSSSRNQTFFNSIGSTIVYDHRWVMKDIPVLHEESYTSSIENYISKIEFQLSDLKIPGRVFLDILSNWGKISEQLMNDATFGAELTGNNRWLDDDMKGIIGNSTDKLEITKKIYDFVRDHFTCTNSASVKTSNLLKNVLKDKNGTEGEINLLLAAMLNHENIHCDPVILSTRNHGFASEIYPLMNRYNYVICHVAIDNNHYFLDASDPLLGFDHLPEYCYNGQAMIISPGNARPVYFIPDSIAEKSRSSVFIVNDEKGYPSGSFQSILGYYESYDLRKKIRKTSEKDFFNGIQSSLNTEVRIENTGIDSLTDAEEPVVVHYDFDFKPWDRNNLVYFIPPFSQAFKENPFTSAQREYPVEMPYLIDKVYTLDMDIPTGFKVDELPKSQKLMLNGNDGSFDYVIQANDNKIQMFSRIKLNKTVFMPEEYSTLREFFADVVNKQREQIVFRRKE